MSIDTKINDIIAIIKDIEKEDAGVAAILFEGLGLSVNLIQQVAANGGRKDIDVTEHLEIASKVLGFSVKDLILNVMQEQSQPKKEADAETLNFITSDLDDYEKFLAQAKAKESIDFLTKQI